MGYGAEICIINGTDTNLKKSYQHSYQMNDWNLPENITPGGTASKYIEYSEGIFEYHYNDAGEAFYELEGTGYFFQIQARWDGSPYVRVFLDSFSTPTHGQGDDFYIPWGYNDRPLAYIVISGSNGNYFFSQDKDASNWMSNNYHYLEDKTLKDVCLPGSHDAGMSILDSGTAFAHECNTLTQHT